MSPVLANCWYIFTLSNLVSLFVNFLETLCTLCLSGSFLLALSLSLSVYLSISLVVYLTIAACLSRIISAYMYVNPSVCLFVNQSIFKYVFCWPVNLFIFLSTYLSFCLFLSICLSTKLHICLAVCCLFAQFWICVPLFINTLSSDLFMWKWDMSPQLKMLHTQTGTYIRFLPSYSLLLYLLYAKKILLSVSSPFFTSVQSTTFLVATRLLKWKIDNLQII